jgi:Fic family protein
MSKTTTTPPYSLTVKSADLIAKITEIVTRLEYGSDFKRDIKLRKHNRIRSIHSSLAIENNTLTLEEVDAIISGKLVSGKHEEIKEVKNAYAAYERILSFNPYSVNDLLQAHKLMTSGLIKESGKLRSGDVGVYNGTTLIHPGARPQFVLQLIEDLFEWAKNSDLHPLVKSSIMHFEIEWIHPFSDGNGRIGRLWQTLLLSKWNEMFAWMPLETVIYENQSKYYEALGKGQTQNDSGIFIEFILESLLKTLEGHINNQQLLGQNDIEGENFNFDKLGVNDSLIDSVNDSLIDSVNDSLIDSVNDSVNDSLIDSVNLQILQHIKENSKVTAAKLSEIIGKSVPTINRRLKQLQEANCLKRVGSDKNGHWEVSNESR